MTLVKGWLEILVFGGAEDGEELSRGLRGDEVLAHVPVSQEAAYGGERLEVRPHGVARAHDEDKQIYRFAVEGLEVKTFFEWTVLDLNQ